MSGAGVVSRVRGEIVEQILNGSNGLRLGDAPFRDEALWTTYSMFSVQNGRRVRTLIKSWTRALRIGPGQTRHTMKTREKCIHQIEAQ